MASKQLYSDTLPDNGIRDLVRRIGSSEDIAGFISQPYMASASESEQGICEWIEAEKSPTKNLWRLTKNTQFVNSAMFKGDKDAQAMQDEAICQTKTIISNISFFDALHYCISEQNYRISQDSFAINPEDIDINILDGFANDVALLSNQPMDLKGLPLPAASGRILVDGTYSAAAKKLADKTRDIDLLPKISNPDYLSNQVDMMPIALSKVVKPLEGEALSNRALQVSNALKVDDILNLNADSSLRAKQLVVGSYYKSNDRLRNIAESAGLYLDGKTYSQKLAPSEHRKSGSGGLLGMSILSGVVLAVPAFIVGSGAVLFAAPLLAATTLLNATFSRDIKRMKKSIKKLPESGYKTMVVDFTKAVEANTYLACTARMANSSTTMSKLEMETGIDLINKASELLEFSEIEHDKLSAAFLVQSFPKQKVFEAKIEELFNDLVEERDAIARALLEKNEVNPDKIEGLIKTWVPKFK